MIIKWKGYLLSQIAWSKGPELQRQALRHSDNHWYYRDENKIYFIFFLSKMY